MAVWRRFRRALRKRISLFDKVAPSTADRKVGVRGKPVIAAGVDGFIDAAWYADAFSLPSARQASKHFRDVGSSKSYAISAALAGQDGRTLAPWAAELLLRLGVRIGAKPGGDIEPDDSRAIRALDIPRHKKRRIAVVTAVFGAVDRLMPVFPALLEEADFFAFVDRQFDDAMGWTLVHSNFYSVEPQRHARFIKTHLPLYFSDYDEVLWIDANIFPCQRPNKILKAFNVEGVDFAVCPHPTSYNLVMEAAACIATGKMDAADLFARLECLNSQSAIGEGPAFDTGVIFMRPRSGPVRKLCASWWREIVRGTNQDQLCLPIALAESKPLAWTFARDQSLANSHLFVRVAHEKDVRS